MKVWIDLATPPHSTFFRPVARELERRGHEIAVTVWDRGQTLALARQVWPEADVVGDGFRRSVLDKGTALWTRARALAEHIRPIKPDLALGHNSYSQIVAARLAGVRSVTAMDYEYQPANHLAFRLANRVILPEAITPDLVRRFGLRRNRLLQYPGLKEDITLADFEPDPAFRASLGIPKEQPLVMVRPPAEGALYHRHGNPLVDRVLAALVATGACVVLSPRTRSQAEQFSAVPGVRVLTEVVSGLDLLHQADLVIGAGGTMTREAAVLGTPVFTVFMGKMPAVDRRLIAEGRLRVLESPADLAAVDLRRRHPKAWRSSSEPTARFVDLVETAAERTPANR